jgi:hypothetical protein
MHLPDSASFPMRIVQTGKTSPHLIAALEQGCAYLTTYNVDDYEPGHPEIDVFRPGAPVQRVREQLSSL